MSLFDPSALELEEELEEESEGGSKPINPFAVLLRPFPDRGGVIAAPRLEGALLLEGALPPTPPGLKAETAEANEAI